MSRLLLVLPSSTYRAADFLDAVAAVGAEVLIASEEEQTLLGARFVRIDLCDPQVSAEQIASAGLAIDAVVGVDEQGVLFAAHLAALLEIPHNPPRAVATTRDKALTRIVLTDAGLEQPAHRLVVDGADVRRAASSVGFPCVVKAVDLAASRGVIRANDPDEADAAAARVRAIVGDDPPLLVESYVPGREVAVEGLLTKGTLEVLAIFDKPDPLEGPYFEETIYVTPSRLDAKTQEKIAKTIARACSAIGLVEGPIHAEARISDESIVVLEVAARSIGGLCSRSLRFGAGISLEEVIVRHALGLDPGELRRTKEASGVMMIPVPSTGTLRAVDGLDDVRAADGVNGVEITVPIGQPITAWPEGDRYLGFIFASGKTPDGVEATLRDAGAKLQVSVD